MGVEGSSDRVRVDRELLKSSSDKTFNYILDSSFLITIRVNFRNQVKFIETNTMNVQIGSLPI